LIIALFHRKKNQTSKIHYWDLGTTQQIHEYVVNELNKLDENYEENISSFEVDIDEFDNSNRSNDDFTSDQESTAEDEDNIDDENFYDESFIDHENDVHSDTEDELGKTINKFLIGIFSIQQK